MALNTFLAVLTTILTLLPWTTLATKRGLPFNNPSTYIKHWNGPGSQITWSYNWDYQIPGDFPGDYLAYVPMLHDPNRRLRGQFGVSFFLFLVFPVEFTINKTSSGVNGQTTVLIIAAVVFSSSSMSPTCRLSMASPILL